MRDGSQDLTWATCPGDASPWQKELRRSSSYWGSELSPSGLGLSSGCLGSMQVKMLSGRAGVRVGPGLRCVLG